MQKKIKIIFLFSLIYLTGCSSPHVNVTIPKKGEVKTLKCKNINFNSNEKIIKMFFNSEKNNIILTPSGINCNIKNNAFITLNTIVFNKTYKILYSKNQKKCSYLIQECIDKNGLILCSKPFENKKLYLEIVNHYKFKNDQFYYYDNNLYKTRKKCLPNYININCKKIKIKLNDIFYVNGKILYLKNHQEVLDPCSFYNTNYIYQTDIENLKQQLYSLKNKTEQSINFYFNKDVNSFIKKFFPHKENINIDINDINWNDLEKNQTLGKLLNKIENNKQITKQDLVHISLILNKIKKQKDFYKNPDYYKIAIIKYILILKLNLVNQKNHKYLIKEIENLKNYLLENSNIKEKKDIEKIINQILSLYKELYLTK